MTVGFVPMLFLLLAFIYDPNYVTNELMIRWPHIYIYTQGHTCAFVSIENTPKLIFGFFFVGILFIFTAVGAGLTLLILTLRTIQSRKEHMSLRTYKLHRHLTLAFSLQVSHVSEILYSRFLLPKTIKSDKLLFQNV